MSICALHSFTNQLILIFNLILGETINDISIDDTPSNIDFTDVKQLIDATNDNQADNSNHQSIWTVVEKTDEVLQTQAGL